MTRKMLLMAVSVLGFSTSVGLAQAPPSGYTVKYFMRETPTDPQSRIEFTVTLGLSSQSWTSSSVSWRIETATFTQPVTGGSRSWSATGPLSTLWTVNHADIAHPAPKEFDQLPQMTGRADAVNPSDPDLDYRMSSRGYTPPPVLFAGDVASMTHVFTVVGEEEPEEEGEDEPVEVIGVQPA